MKRKVVQITELDARLQVVGIDILSVCLFTISLFILLYIQISPDEKYVFALGLLAAVMLVYITVVLFISLLCGRNYMRFINIVKWPTKYILKEK